MTSPLSRISYRTYHTKQWCGQQLIGKPKNAGDLDRYWHAAPTSFKVSTPFILGITLTSTPASQLHTIKPPRPSTLSIFPYLSLCHTFFNLSPASPNHVTTLDLSLNICRQPDSDMSQNGPSRSRPGGPGGGPPGQLGGTPRSPPRSLQGLPQGPPSPTRGFEGFEPSSPRGPGQRSGGPSRQASPALGSSTGGPSQTGPPGGGQNPFPPGPGHDPGRLAPRLSEHEEALKLIERRIDLPAEAYLQVSAHICPLIT